jgi:hypothetical protein
LYGLVLLQIVQLRAQLAHEPTILIENGAQRTLRRCRRERQQP